MAPPRPAPAARRGTVLIVVSGLVALITALALSFLSRMRTDIEETNGLVQDSQARIMLLAGCDYILEAGRLGYDRPLVRTPDAAANSPANLPNKKHREAFGWIDVRGGDPSRPDQLIGPRGDDDVDLDGVYDPFWDATPVERSDVRGPADRPAWPAIKSVARCPMYVMRRAPYANQVVASYNPIAVAGPDTGYPYLRNPDPQPVTDNGYGTPSGVNDAKWTEYIDGDRRPRANSTGLSWFRVYRDEIATFIVTCGAGGSQGFRDWYEVPAAKQAEFNNDKAYFDQVAAGEVRLWYRVQWSAAVMALDYYNLAGDMQPKDFEHFMRFPMNASHFRVGSKRTALWNKNFVGTIQWVQRLPTEPTHW